MANSTSGVGSGSPPQKPKGLDQGKATEETDIKEKALDYAHAQALATVGGEFRRDHQVSWVDDGLTTWLNAKPTLQVGFPGTDFQKENSADPFRGKIDPKEVSWAKTAFALGGGGSAPVGDAAFGFSHGREVTMLGATTTFLDVKKRFLSKDTTLDKDKLGAALNQVAAQFAETAKAAFTDTISSADALKLEMDKRDRTLLPGTEFRISKNTNFSLSDSLGKGVSVAVGASENSAKHIKLLDGHLVYIGMSLNQTLTSSIGLGYSEKPEVREGGNALERAVKDEAANQLTASGGGAIWANRSPDLHQGSAVLDMSNPAHRKLYDEFRDVPSDKLLEFFQRSDVKGATYDGESRAQGAYFNLHFVKPLLAVSSSTTTEEGTIRRSDGTEAKGKEVTSKSSVTGLLAQIFAGDHYPDSKVFRKGEERSISARVVQMTAPDGSKTIDGLAFSLGVTDPKLFVGGQDNEAAWWSNYLKALGGPGFDEAIKKFDPTKDADVGRSTLNSTVVLPTPDMKHYVENYDTDFFRVGLAASFHRLSGSWPHWGRVDGSPGALPADFPSREFLAKLTPDERKLGLNQFKSWKDLYDWVQLSPEDAAKKLPELRADYKKYTGGRLLEGDLSSYSAFQDLNGAFLKLKKSAQTTPEDFTPLLKTMKGLSSRNAAAASLTLKAMIRPESAGGSGGGGATGSFHNDALGTHSTEGKVGLQTLAEIVGQVMGPPTK